MSRSVPLAAFGGAISANAYLAQTDKSATNKAAIRLPGAVVYAVVRTREMKA
jgi:hypothetical protein